MNNFPTWWGGFQAYNSLGFPTLPSYILYLPIYRDSYLGGVGVEEKVYMMGYQGGTLGTLLTSVSGGLVGARSQCT
jgi:hypothetical protein